MKRVTNIKTEKVFVIGGPYQKLKFKSAKVEEGECTIPQRGRITSKNYQTNKEEEDKKEKCKKEGYKSQEEGEEILEAEPLLAIAHIFDE